MPAARLAVGLEVGERVQLGMGTGVILVHHVQLHLAGRVLEEIAVDLPRPRSWDALNDDAQFKELTGRVLQLVRSA
jgi:hypothetical protein